MSEMRVEHIADQCWSRIEGLRHRMKSACMASSNVERASIDAEIIELRDFVWAALMSSKKVP